jgi:hypothetical protein
MYPRMEFPLDLESHGISRRVAVETGGFFSRSQLLIDGNPAPQGTQQGEFVLPKDDGGTLKARLRGVMLDPVPVVIIDGKTLRVAPPFSLAQTFAAALSFLIALSMSIAGLLLMPRPKTPGIQLMGFLCMTINLFMGVLLGFTSMIANRRILRSDMSRSSQIFSIGALTIIVIIGFLVTFLLLVGILSLFSDLENNSVLG